MPPSLGLKKTVCRAIFSLLFQTMEKITPLSQAKKLGLGIIMVPMNHNLASKSVFMSIALPLWVKYLFFILSAVFKLRFLGYLHFDFER
jgi:hypothetical protein